MESVTSATTAGPSQAQSLSRSADRLSSSPSKIRSTSPTKSATRFHPYHENDSPTRRLSREINYSPQFSISPNVQIREFVNQDRANQHSGIDQNLQASPITPQPHWQTSSRLISQQNIFSDSPPVHICDFDSPSSYQGNVDVSIQGSPVTESYKGTPLQNPWANEVDSPESYEGRPFHTQRDENLIKFAKSSSAAVPPTADATSISAPFPGATDYMPSIAALRVWSAEVPFQSCDLVAGTPKHGANPLSNVSHELKKNLANKIFGYLARCEFWLKLGWRFWILVGYVYFFSEF